MIYDTTFKNSIVSSFDDGSSQFAYTRLNYGLLVLYSGAMPTHEEFVSDWDALYKVYSSSSLPINIAATTGNNVVAAYGTSANDPTESVYINKINNEFYLNSNITPRSTKLRDDTPTFAMLALDTAAYSNRIKSSISSYATGYMNYVPFMLLSVSDLDGNGIVKLSTTDMTQSSAAPTLMSLEFEVNIGE